MAWTNAKRVLTCVLAGLALLAGPASAQDYPRRQIRVLEPLAAASAVDVIARIVADRMGQLLGQGLYVVNQPGAAGLLGMRTGVNAAPDGYTILAVNDSVMTVLPNMTTDAGYDPIAGFEPITLLARLHWALIANPTFAASTVPELIALAREKPGSINFGSGGQGSPQHLAMELLMRAAGIKLRHVPFRGVTQALNDVVSGHIPLMFIALPGPLPFLSTHQIKILGTGDLQRLATLPDVPTIAEQGVPGFEFIAWAALVAPKGTPAPIIATLHHSAAAAMAEPAINKQLTDLGYEVVGSTPDELRTTLARDFAAKAELIRAANIHAD